ncbi:MAG: hypothetical protein F2881_08210, partial [Actinobacteria bacterium]|nr:hypothetical protein [Actinomycetota bacterium]
MIEQTAPADLVPRGQPTPLLTRRGLRWAAALMIAGQLLIRAVALSGSYFTSDDFLFMRFASLTQLSADYLFLFYNGHFMPAGFLYVWFHQYWFPGSYQAAVAAILLLQCAISVAMWVLLTRLFGYRAA